MHQTLGSASRIAGGLAACLLASISHTLAQDWSPDDNRYSKAVIVANKTYSDVFDVAYADRDGTAIKHFLINHLGYREGNITILANATKGVLEQWFGDETNRKGKLFHRVRPGRSNVFVYLTSHGAPDRQTRRAYVIPTDVDPNTPTRGYSLDLLERNLSLVKAKIGSDRRLVLMLDACFSGKSPGGSWQRHSGPPITPVLPNTSGKIIRLSAAGPGELAYWDSKAKHGLFTGKFLAAWRGAADQELGGNKDGIVTWDEVRRYVSEEVNYWAAHDNDGNQQTPELPDIDTLPWKLASIVRPPIGIVPEKRGPASKHRYKPGDKIEDCGHCPELVVVPSGSFLMGSPKNESGRKRAEGPQHEVTISNPFAVSIHEITYDQWDACALEGGCNGYEPKAAIRGRGSHPVAYVSFEDAKAYVAWLKAMTGKPYRLLSEAEWEYAARGGTNTPFMTGKTLMTKHANVDGSTVLISGRPQSTRGKPAEVGSFSPNPYGLYDMHGNLMEWVEDCWNDSHEGAQPDGNPRGGNCRRRVLKGGSWYHGPSKARVSARMSFPRSARHNITGFRIALTLQ
ncbi:MAG: SUMF1/EgtB/PvdO family nonheme iron enzyme [Methyloligellaceae bacterium]